MKKEIKGLRAVMFSNIAICHMKRGENAEAKYYLKRCLEIEPGNVKA
jgi:Tfp pilus assembly protein PilF